MKFVKKELGKQSSNPSVKAPPFNHVTDHSSSIFKDRLQHKNCMTSRAAFCFLFCPRFYGILRVLNVGRKNSFFLINWIQK